MKKGPVTAGEIPSALKRAESGGRDGQDRCESVRWKCLAVCWGTSISAALEVNHRQSAMK